jgi:endonuclease/exonuclease/phosphatase family metal-dependent hydrolase
LAVTVLRRILWTLGWSAAGLLVLAFLLGYAAPYLSPARFWWTDLFAVFLFPLSLMVGALGLGVCGYGVYRRKWGRVALAAVLLGLIVIRFGPRLAAWGPAPSSTNTLGIMSLNVPPSFTGTDAPNTALTELVQAEAPDILAFQESLVRTGDGDSSSSLIRVSSSIEPLLNDAMRFTLPRALPSNVNIQQPVLGQLSLDSMSVHPLPPQGNTNARSRYTRTQFTWRGRSAVLYNVHLHTVGPVRPWETMTEGGLSLSQWRTFLRTYRKGALRRAQQARLIRRRIARESDPVIVVGDFNSTPHQWAYRHIAQGLQSAATQRIPGWAATFPAQYPLVRIDHVLASSDWQIVTAQIPAPAQFGMVSDHRPVLARLRWKAPSGPLPTSK